MDRDCTISHVNEIHEWIEGEKENVMSDLSKIIKLTPRAESRPQQSAAGRYHSGSGDRIPRREVPGRQTNRHSKQQGDQDHHFRDRRRVRARRDLQGSIAHIASRGERSDQIRCGVVRGERLTNPSLLTPSRYLSLRPKLSNALSRVRPMSHSRDR